MNNPVKVESSREGTILTSVLLIDAPKDVVWNILKFPGKVDTFHPLIKKSYMTTDKPNGLGAKRHCDLLPMGEFDEIITNWVEGLGYTIEVFDGKMLPPHNFMKGNFEIRAIEEKTEVKFSFSYQLKYGLLGQILDLIFIRPQFKKAPPKFVRGLKEYVEGSLVTQPVSAL